VETVKTFSLFSSFCQATVVNGPHILLNKLSQMPTDFVHHERESYDGYPARLGAPGRQIVSLHLRYIPSAQLFAPSSCRWFNWL